MTLKNLDDKTNVQVIRQGESIYAVVIYQERQVQNCAALGQATSNSLEGMCSKNLSRR